MQYIFRTYDRPDAPPVSEPVQAVGDEEARDLGVLRLLLDARFSAVDVMRGNRIICHLDRGFAGLV